jgi:hypothetical protein
MRPQPGQIVYLRGVECRIVRIRPAGTIDVEATDRSGRRWRVSGLPFVEKQPEPTDGPQVCPNCGERHWSFYGCFQ